MYVRTMLFEEGKAQKSKIWYKFFSRIRSGLKRFLNTALLLGESLYTGPRPLNLEGIK